MPTLDLDLDHLERILPRYDRAVPRYTSYPTAPVWSEAYDAEAFRADLAELGERTDQPLSLYVHVPFCRSLCHFCACNRIITKDAALPARYLETVRREVATIREAVPDTGRLASQQHWGGGTPTHLAPDQIRTLFETVVDAFPMQPGAEISIEVDPRVTTAAHVDALRACGFGRMSMGVQDFDPRVQEAIHRIQPADQTGALVEQARAGGFESVNFDLIYGLPYQTEESFARTLDTVIELAPDRLALYAYAHVTWVAKQQRGFERKDLPDPGTRLRIMLMAIRRLLDAGYEFIGLDHFARPDDELAQALRDGTLRRNFMGHTTQEGVELLGFGPTAISELAGSYAQSQRGLEEWEAAARAGELATMRGFRLSADDQERRWLISRLISLGRVDASEFERRTGRSFAESYGPELARLAAPAEDGLVEIAADGSVAVTPAGRVLVRNLATAFDAYLPDREGDGTKVFSRSV